jgi:phosphatidate cytidylyltransferase
MLLQRILTAVPLGILAVWFVLTQSAESLSYALLFFIAISAWEWSMLCGFNHKMIRVAYAITVVLSIYGFSLLIVHQYLTLQMLLFVTVIWWLFVIYRMSVKHPEEATEKASVIKMLIGFITLVPPVFAMTHIHGQPQGAYWLLYTISLVWVADTGAYFAGKKFGKVKLAPKLSPGKTREGFYGAVFATGLYSIIAGYALGLDFIQMVELLIIGFFATVFSVAGDLSISLLKRERGVKDTGSILPGHGGILDRIDSIMPSAPLFALLLSVFIFNG